MMRMHFEHLKRFSQSQNQHKSSAWIDFRITLTQLLLTTIVALGGAYVIFNMVHNEPEEEHECVAEGSADTNQVPDAQKSKSAPGVDKKELQTLRRFEESMKTEKGKIVVVACSGAGAGLLERIILSGAFATDPIMFAVKSEVASNNMPGGTMSLSESRKSRSNGDCDLVVLIRAGSKWRGLNLDRIDRGENRGGESELRSVEDNKKHKGGKFDDADIQAVRSWIEKILLGEIKFDPNDESTPCPI
jgi:hypothetical protein